MIYVLVCNSKKFRKGFPSSQINLQPVKLSPFNNKVLLYLIQRVKHPFRSGHLRVSVCSGLVKRIRDTEAVWHVKMLVKNPPCVRFKWIRLMTAFLIPKLDGDSLIHWQTVSCCYQCLREYENTQKDGQKASSSTLTHPPAGYPSHTALIQHNASIKPVCVHA